MYVLPLNIIIKKHNSKQLDIHFIMQKVDKRGTLKVYCRCSKNLMSLHEPNYAAAQKINTLNIKHKYVIIFLFESVLIYS